MFGGKVKFYMQVTIFENELIFSNLMEITKY